MVLRFLAARFVFGRRFAWFRVDLPSGKGPNMDGHPSIWVEHRITGRRSARSLCGSVSRGAGRGDRRFSPRFWSSNPCVLRGFACVLHAFAPVFLENKSRRASRTSTKWCRKGLDRAACDSAGTLEARFEPACPIQHGIKVRAMLCSTITSLTPVRLEFHLEISGVLGEPQPISREMYGN